MVIAVYKKKSACELNQLLQVVPVIYFNNFISDNHHSSIIPSVLIFEPRVIIANKIQKVGV